MGGGVSIGKRNKVQSGRESDEGMEGGRAAADGKERRGEKEMG